MALQQFRLSEYSHLTFSREWYDKNIQIGELWSDEERRFFISTPQLTSHAILLENEEWFQCLYNSSESLIELISLLEVDFPKFIALPEAAWEYVKSKWPSLHFNDHHVYFLNKGIDFAPQIPEGIAIDHLREADISFLLKHQPYINEYGGQHYLMHRIKVGLTIGLRIEDKLIAWVILHDDGTIGFLRVLSKFRGMGYSKMVLNALISLVISKNKNIIAHVSVHNKRAIKLAEKYGAIKVGMVSWVRQRTEKEIRQYEQGIF